MPKIAYSSIEQRSVRGRKAREQTPVSSHAKCVPVTDRADPVALLEEQNVTREPDLVPVRHGRMMEKLAVRGGKRAEKAVGKAHTRDSLQALSKLVWTLARAHTRSGDPVAIAAYLGDNGKFDRSITGFSWGYANQNEQDFQQFVKTVRAGRLEALEGV